MITASVLIKSLEFEKVYISKADIVYLCETILLT